MKKALLWIIGSLVGLAALAYVAVLLFFPTEKLRVYFEEAGAEALGQPVQIGALSVSVWGGVGIELHNALIGDSLKPPILAHVKTVDVKLRFWSALFGNYEVDYVTLVKPELALVYATDGSTNFDLPDDITADVPGAVYQAPVGGAPIDDETAVLFGGLSLGDLRVRDGVLLRRNDLTQSELTVWGLQFAGDLKPLLNNDVHGLFTSVGELAIDSAQFLSWEEEIAGAEIQGERITDKIRLPRLAISYDGRLNLGDPAITLNEAKISALGLMVSVSGELKNLTTDPAIDFAYTVSGNDLADFAASLQELAPDVAKSLTALEGTLAANGSAQYQYGAKPKYNAEGAISDFRFHPEGAPEAIVSELIQFEISEKNLAITVDTLVSGVSKLKLALGLENFDDPQITCDVNGGTSLSVLSAFLPQGGQPQLQGAASVDLALSGPLHRPELMNISGAVEVRNGSLQASTLPEQLKRFEIRLAISPKKIQVEQFDLQFESSDLSLTGEIVDPFPYLLPVEDSIKSRYPSPYLTFESHSRCLNIDKLFPEAAPGSGVNRASLPPSELPPLPVPQINGAGVARFDTLIYTEIEFTEVRSDIRLEKARIYCDNVTGTVYNGAASGDAVVDLTDFDRPVYTGKFHADSLDVGSVLERFLPWGSASAIHGKIKLDGNYASSGWEPADFLKSLSMDLTSSGSKLILQNSPVIKQTFDAISQYSGKSYGPKDYEKLDLRSFAGSVKLKDGKIVTDKFNASTGQLGDFLLDGAIGLDGKLDLKCDFAPNESIRSDLLSKGGIAGALSGLLSQSQDGKLSVPLRITGTSDKPRVSIDEVAFKAILDKALNEQGAGLLKGLFKNR